MGDRGAGKAGKTTDKKKGALPHNNNPPPTTMSYLPRTSRRVLSSTASGDLFVIFGAAVGNIGGALSAKLLTNQPGSQVHIVGRSQDKLSALEEHLAGLTGQSDRVHTAVIDAVNDPKAVDELFSKQLAGVPTGVANCIGSVILKPAHSTTDAEWRSTLDTNATSAFNILRAASKKMMRGDGGSIALCASAVALHGVQNHEAIAAAKGAVAAMAKSAASTYAPKNIRVNAVAPGLIATPMTSKITSNEAARKASEAMHALKRIGTPEDVASALEFFLNPSNSFVTGQVLGVCGGLSSVRAQ